MAALYAMVAYWSPFLVGALLIVPILAILVGIARAGVVGPAEPTT
jgi:hypothetical protein